MFIVKFIVKLEQNFHKYSIFKTNHTHTNSLIDEKADRQTDGHAWCVNIIIGVCCPDQQTDINREWGWCGFWLTLHFMLFFLIFKNLMISKFVWLFFTFRTSDTCKTPLTRFIITIGYKIPTLLLLCLFLFVPLIMLWC